MKASSSDFRNLISRSPALKALILPAARNRSRVSIEIPRRFAASARDMLAEPDIATSKSSRSAHK
jgi:hypothetical protein